jgi:hypothetical protein
MLQAVNEAIDIVKTTCSHILPSGILFYVKTFASRLSKEFILRAPRDDKFEEEYTSQSS